MGLEIPAAGKAPGTEVRRTPASRPAAVGLMILALTLIEFLFVGLVGNAVFVEGANDAAGHDPSIPEGTINIGFRQISFFKNEQTIVSFWLACIFYCLFAIILLYQRYFKDHVTIAKRRFRKWEDEGVQLHD